MTAVDFQALVEQSADVVAVFDREHRYVYVNAALEQATGVRISDVVGKRNDDVMPPEAAAMWREALDHVFATGESRSLECTLDTPHGPRRFASLAARVGEHACVVSRDVTDLESTRLFDVAVRTMMLGMCVIEAPSGRILFQNDRTMNVWGPASRAVDSKQDYDAHVAFDRRGQRIRGTMWPAVRALGGETVVDERIELIRGDGLRKSISINASPVRDAQDRITSVVVTYQDVTQATRAHDAAIYLAKAGELLAQFDPETSLQAIVELAVPVLADRAMIHLRAGGQPIVAAFAHTDAEKHAATRMRIGQPYALSPETAVARVLAGGPAELVQIDAAVLERAATDPAQLEHLRAQGYRSTVVAPLSGRDGVLGALSFSTAESGRRYEQTDLEMLAELARRTGIALDNARLFAQAEAARIRERVLHETAARLSSSLTIAQIAQVVCEQVVSALGVKIAVTGLRVEDTVQIVGTSGIQERERLEPLMTLPLNTPLPLCEAVRASEIVWCGTVAELEARYPQYRELWTTAELRSWGAVPFSLEGRTIGAMAITFRDERVLAADDRDLLRAVGQLAAHAIERARLHEALQESEAELRSALAAARGGTWRVDLTSMSTTRDPSYGELLGIPAGVELRANFDDIHPDDREIAAAAFERARTDDLPYAPEVRVRRGDGSYIWTRTYARVTRDKTGRPRSIGGITFDIDEAKRAEQEARLAERRKDEFLAMLGHELRNPLAPITTALDLLDLKGARSRESDVIRRQVDHLTRLIDDLLDVSRITRGELDLVREVVETGEIVARAIEMASPLLEKRQHRLSVDVARSGLPIDVDPIRLAQVIHNLLTNAAKYSERHADIAITAHSTADAIVIDVSDSGMGIAPDLLPRLFDLFVQGERTIDRAEGGLGIGLAIARSLCELHGGSITAASDGPGHGSTFTIRLPRATRPLTPRSERATDKMPKLTRGMRVLVVDDNADAAAMLQTYLAELGHEPAIAHDGVAALELAGTFKPDVCVLDIGLPVMDGYELARRLRDQQGRDKLRLIALTGYGQEADRRRAAEAGFEHHLVKPVAIEALTSLLAK